MATEDDGKKGGGWSESGFDASIPVWDGRADSLREYKRTVRWWLSSVDLERTRFFNLAARFAMKQRGSARLTQHVQRAVARVRKMEEKEKDMASIQERAISGRPLTRRLILRRFRRPTSWTSWRRSP